MENVYTCELLDWIDGNSITLYGLSCNSNATHILEKNLKKINWEMLS